MEKLVEFSRRYGADTALVLAGGGNTSMKENGVLYVKGSGTALASITAEDFVAMDMAALLAITKKAYPADDAARESAFLADVMAAKLKGQENKRPSVETLLHALFPQRYVLHLHPALVNGLTCAIDGVRAAARLFPGAVWIPERRPGYTLAMSLAMASDTDVASKPGPDTDTVLLQNHGVFFAADDAVRLDKMLNAMLDGIRTEMELSENTVEYAQPELCKPFTPDHIVYCGVGPELPDSENARLLWEDARLIAEYSRYFGGARPMSDDLKEFILNWEAESYRKAACRR